MTGVSDFIGVWSAASGFPYSSHTITWELDGQRLRGRWLIEAARPPGAHADQDGPKRFEMQLGEPWIEDGVLLFHVNGGPYASEFRLAGQDEAIVGAAVDKLPPELRKPELQRSIEAHRARVRRGPALTHA